ncbi:hypothetical protein Lal_00001170 [Lupinus albus]|nr:hypothetical protein Lal_00001170 [Lupinus albus]
MDSSSKTKNSTPQMTNIGDSIANMDEIHMDNPTRDFLHMYLSQQHTPSSSSSRPPPHPNFQSQRPQHLRRPQQFQRPQHLQRPQQFQRPQQLQRPQQFQRPQQLQRPQQFQRPQRLPRFQAQRSQQLQRHQQFRRPQRLPRFQAQRPRPLPKAQAEGPLPQQKTQAEGPLPQQKAQAEGPPPQQPKAEAQNPPLQQLRAEAQSPLPQPKAQAPAPGPLLQPEAETQSPLPQPKAQAPGPLLQPEAETQSPLPQPMAQAPAPGPLLQQEAETQCPLPQPKAQAPGPLLQPEAETQSLLPQPKAQAPAPGPLLQQEAETQCPLPQPKAQAPGPLLQPEAEAQNPLPQPKAQAPALGPLFQLEAEVESPLLLPKAEAQNSLPQPKAQAPAPAPGPLTQPKAQAQSPHTSDTKVQHSQSSAETVAAITTAPNLVSSRLFLQDIPESKLYKNQLQEFTQKSRIELPTYQTVNEGTRHVPMFRSTLWVSGKCYTNQVTFVNRKAAEQDAAKLALKSLLGMIKDEAPPAVIEEKAPPAVIEEKAPPVAIKDEASPTILEKIWLSKSILNEYAFKLNVALPTYSTVETIGASPVFKSTLVFNCTKYTGGASRHKRWAEQLAAHQAILSILSADPGSESLSEIVKLNTGISAAVAKKIDSTDLSATVENTGHACHSLDLNKRVAGLEKPIGEASTLRKRRRDKRRANKKARLESLSEIVKLNTGISAAVAKKIDSTDLSATVENTGHACYSLDLNKRVAGLEKPIGEASTLRKRRRDKRRANKKARLETPLSVAATFPMDEMPPCLMGSDSVKMCDQS